jgi:hypothetical protein
LLIAPSQVQKVDASKKKTPVTASDSSEKADGLESDIVSDRLALAQLNVLPHERQEEINHIEIEGQWGAKVKDYFALYFRRTLTRLLIQLDFLIRHLKVTTVSERARDLVDVVTFCSYSIGNAFIRMSSISYVTLCL